MLAWTLQTGRLSRAPHSHSQAPAVRVSQGWWEKAPHTHCETEEGQAALGWPRALERVGSGDTGAVQPSRQLPHGPSVSLDGPSDLRPAPWPHTRSLLALSAPTPALPPGRAPSELSRAGSTSPGGFLDPCPHPGCPRTQRCLSQSRRREWRVGGRATGCTACWSRPRDTGWTSRRVNICSASSGGALGDRQ